MFVFVIVLLFKICVCICNCISNCNYNVFLSLANFVTMADIERVLIFTFAFVFHLYLYFPLSWQFMVTFVASFVTLPGVGQGEATTAVSHQIFLWNDGSVLLLPYVVHLFHRSFNLKVLRSCVSHQTDLFVKWWPSMHLLNQSSKSK